MHRSTTIQNTCNNKVGFAGDVIIRPTAQPPRHAVVQTVCPASNAEGQFSEILHRIIGFLAMLAEEFVIQGVSCLKQTYGSRMQCSVLDVQTHRQAHVATSSQQWVSLRSCCQHVPRVLAQLQGSRCARQHVHALGADSISGLEDQPLGQKLMPEVATSANCSPYSARSRRIAPHLC